MKYLWRVRARSCVLRCDCVYEKLVLVSERVCVMRDEIEIENVWRIREGCEYKWYVRAFGLFVGRRWNLVSPKLSKNKLLSLLNLLFWNLWTQQLTAWADMSLHLLLHPKEVHVPCVKEYKWPCVSVYDERDLGSVSYREIDWEQSRPFGDDSCRENVGERKREREESNVLMSTPTFGTFIYLTVSLDFFHSSRLEFQHLIWDLISHNSIHSAGRVCHFFFERERERD